MNKSDNPEMSVVEDEKKKLKEENKRLSNERKEAKKRAKEIRKQEQEMEDGESNGFLTLLATIFIVLLWIGVICAIIKLDVGGFGTNVVAPLIKDVPVINKILPNNVVTETIETEDYGGFKSLKDAVEQIKTLELELENAQNSYLSRDEDLASLKAEVLRLQEFEKKQVEFQRIKTEFYEEVVYAEKGPGAEAYQKYYQSMDPSTAEHLYKQVIAQLQESSEIQEFAAGYAKMKPANAAKIFEEMTDNFELVTRILNAMGAESRGKILEAMDPSVAAKITKIMDPES